MARLFALIISLFALVAQASAQTIVVSDCAASAVGHAAGSRNEPVAIDTSGRTCTVPGSPVTSGGLSVYFVQPTAGTNAANIKSSAGQVYKIEATNNSATVNYVRLYDAGAGFTGCNSATNLKWQMAIPASTAGAGFSSSWDLGMAFSTGISICVTSGYATTDTTNATASALSVSVGYK